MSVWYWGRLLYKLALTIAVSSSVWSGRLSMSGLVRPPSLLLGSETPICDLPFLRLRANGLVRPPSLCSGSETPSRDLVV